MYRRPLQKVYLIFFRKDRPVGHIFGSGFSWSEAFDAAAEIYNGVGSKQRGMLIAATLITRVVRLLVDANVPCAYRVV